MPCRVYASHIHSSAFYPYMETETKTSPFNHKALLTQTWRGPKFEVAVTSYSIELVPRPSIR